MSIKHPRTRENVEITALNVLWFVFVQYCDEKCAKNVILLMKQERGACSLLLRTSASRSSSTESADVCADVCLFVQMFVCAGVRRSGEWVKRSGCCASAEVLGRINTLMMWSLHLHHHQLSGCLGQSLRSNPLSRCLTFDDVSRPASVSGVEMICDWRTVRKPTCCRLKHEELPRV